MSKDLALMQIGIRSTIEGAKYLMDNDLLGTRYFGVVKDEKDRDQQRMHLDTIFNLIDDKNVIMLDFDDKTLPANARRDVDIYEQKEPGGKYTLIETIDFEKYLVKSGYNIIKASNKDQEEFMINFANIGKFDGKYVLLTSNGKFADVMKQHKIDVIVEYLPEFKEVNKMHGSFHCVTQIFR